MAQKNVVQPGDPVVASSSNSPGSEGVANAIDGKTTKYLNFDSRTPNNPPSGFIVSPSIGVTRVTGMRIQLANDAPERDPKHVTLEGSNDATVGAFDTGNWESIAEVDFPASTVRFEWQSATFSNFKPYKHYRWTSASTQTPNGCCMQVAEVELLGSALPPDVTQPGDPIIASSSNSPGSEGVANVIDNKTTKYLNFDSRTPNNPPSGFVVSPAIGRTVVSGMTIQSANDAPERDPKTVTLEGSNDDTVTTFSDGNWTSITTIDVPAFASRFETKTFLFDNVRPFKHYRWTSQATATPNGCCMQVAEVELLGTGAPKDITQPGDAILASSSNSPGSEGVANVIDNKTTKYLNFDSRTPNNPPSGFAVTPAVGATTVTGMTIQSANDAPERDPKTVTLEGSNDEALTSYSSGNWELITTIDVPAFASRFQTQEFFFANAKSYKHYRWVSTATQTPNGCCMQVAEVELLAVTEGADCSKARFVSQPVNQPVLAGSSATFLALVNGPWPLQWTRNGNPIPGATGNSFTTAPVTAENANDVYAVNIVGCEKSADVIAQIFTPSATRSIGINFLGGGANGAPTSSRVDDIAGIQLQAYWNNANGSTGSRPDGNTDPVTPLLDSNGLEMTGVEGSDISFDYAAGGTWGSGTADATATDRLLNGLTGRNGPGSASTYTFNNVPAGTHSVIAYSVAPPLQFQVVSYNIGDKTYFMRVLNSDEYNAAPGFYRGSATTQAGATLGDFVRFDGIVLAEAGSVTLTVETVTSGDREVGVNALQLLLNTGAAGVPPAITENPMPTVAEAGKTARLRVEATGAGLTYQWRKGGRNISDGGNISGARTAELTIAEISAADVGVYSVAVFNASGSVISRNASVSLSTYNINQNLVGYWKLDETSGTVGANSVAGGQAAIVKGAGAATWAPGKVDGAITLDGSTYLFVTNYTKAKAAISGSAWVKLDPTSGGDVVIFRNQQGAMSQNGGAGRLVGQFEVGLNFDANTGMFHAMAAVGLGPNLARATATADFSVDAWHNVQFTADGAQLRVYVDGAEVAVVDYLAEINPPSTDWISMGGQLNLVDANDPSLGLDFDTAGGKALIGSLDDVALWTRALTAQEVALVYAAGNTGKAVTTVVVPKPATNPALTFSRTGNNITINFDAGKLQSSPTAGPGAVWTDVTNPTQSPHSEAIGAGNRFFRAIVP
jgi:hypothetical protein